MFLVLLYGLSTNCQAAEIDAITIFSVNVTPDIFSRVCHISHDAVHTLSDATSGPLLIVRKLSTAVRVPEIRTE